MTDNDGAVSSEETIELTVISMPSAVLSEPGSVYAGLRSPFNAFGSEGSGGDTRSLEWTVTPLEGGDYREAKTVSGTCQILGFPGPRRL